MHRLGAGILRLGGFLLSCLAYSYLELLDVRGQGNSGNSSSKGFSALLASSLGELAPGLEEAVPPILKRLWLNHLPFLLLLLLMPALLLPGTSLLGVNAALFYGCLLAAALRDPAAVPSSSSSTDGVYQQEGAWTSVLSLGLFLLSAALYWAEPGGGGAQSGDKVRFRPYEAEIRQLLLKHDPGRLHLVDGMLRAHRWNPRRLFKELQAEYAHHAPPPPPPAPAAAASTSAARRPPSARSTATTASAASSVPSPPSAAATTTAAAAAAYQQYAGAGISRGAGVGAVPPPPHSQSQRGVYGAYDDEEEEFYDDAQGTTATGAVYARGEEKASVAYSGAGRYLHATTTTQQQQQQQQQQQRGYAPGSAVSAVMEASRAYQEGILARQQERIRALHVSSSPAHRSYSQPAAGSPGRAAGAGGRAYRSAYSQR